MKARVLALIAMLIVPCAAGAWIAYGFKSGMSRFDATSHLADRQSLAITEGMRQTLAGSADGDLVYDLVYCATPQRLYLMRYRLPDTPAAFVRTLEKFERRYGEPEGLGDISAQLDPAAWEHAVITLLWNLNEAETILLTRDADGARVEFQDVSVCR